MPLFTTRKPIIDEEETIIPCEDDLVIDEMDDFEEEVKKPAKTYKIVLVRRT